MAFTLSCSGSDVDEALHPKDDLDKEAHGAETPQHATPICNAATGLWNVNGEDLEGAKCLGVDGMHGSDGNHGTDGKDGADGKDGVEGQSCDVSPDGAYFVMTCGGAEKATWARVTCRGVPYDPDTQKCDKGKVDCKEYDPDTQFCYNNSKVGDICAGNPQEYDPDLYECREGKNGVYLKGDKSYEGEVYEAVLIGT
jgi:hypothetical protein